MFLNTVRQRGAWALANAASGGAERSGPGSSRRPRDPRGRGARCALQPLQRRADRRLAGDRLPLRPRRGGVAPGARRGRGPSAASRRRPRR